MSQFQDFFSPVWGLFLVFVILVAYRVLSSVQLRRRWRRQRRPVEPAPTDAQVRAAQRAERAMDFFSLVMRRSYYVITVSSACVLVILTYIPLENRTQWIVRLALTAITLGGTLILLLYWHSWADQQERLLRKRVRIAEEHALAQSGVMVRDALTDLYTYEFMIHALELQIAKTFLQPTPITCVMFELTGLDTFRGQHDVEDIQRVLASVGQAIIRSVRPYDVACRYGPQRFAVAMLRCPAQYGDRIGARISRSVNRMALDELNRRYGTSFKLIWRSVTMPDQALTPIQMLHIASYILDMATQSSSDMAALV